VDRELSEAFSALHEKLNVGTSEIKAGQAQLSERVASLETAVKLAHKPPCEHLANLESHHNGLRAEVVSRAKSSRAWTLAIVPPLLVLLAGAIFAVLWKVGR